MEFLDEDLLLLLVFCELKLRHAYYCCLNNDVLSDMFGILKMLLELSLNYSASEVFFVLS